MLKLKQFSVHRFVLVLIVVLSAWVAFLPTLQFDYAPQDQWRAFRYTLQDEGVLSRLKSCASIVSPFYVKSGRPLVWIGECLEHGYVAKISDFKVLRYISISILILTILLTGYVISNILGSIELGLTAALLFSFTPSFTFMYFQGLTGAPVILSALLGVTSFHLIHQAVGAFVGSRKTDLLRLGYGLLAFVSACMIYPAWAFIVVPLMLLFLGLEPNVKLSNKLKKFIYTSAIYLFGALAYFGLIKLMILLNFLGSADHPPIGTYELSMQLNHNVLADRLRQVVDHYISMPMLNLSGFKLSVITLLLFLLISTRNLIISNNEIIRQSAPKILIFLLLSIISFAYLVGTLSPWFFSHMEGLAERHVLGWDFFLIVTFFYLLSLVSKLSTVYMNRLKYAVHLVAVFILIQGVFTQNKLSFAETTVSMVEMSVFRGEIKRWVDLYKAGEKKDILVVRPSHDRPDFIQNLLISGYSGMNAAFSTRANPEHIYQIFTALLRERLEKADYAGLTFNDCRFDSPCTNAISNAINVKQVEAVDFKMATTSDFVINLSKLDF